jgi:AbrB family looped-hinge helix DNA binding protein
MSLVKIQRKGQFTIPTAIRSRLGLSDGDLVDVKVRNASIILTPHGAMDRSKFPNADDEYTPAQRRIIDARLAAADKDIAEGRVYGPFETVREFERSLQETAPKAGTRPKRSARR